jgi:hypothetical protein
MRFSETAERKGPAGMQEEEEVVEEEEEGEAGARRGAGGGGKGGVEEGGEERGGGVRGRRFEGGYKADTLNTPVMKKRMAKEDFEVG